VIWQHFWQFLAVFSLPMHRNGYLWVKILALELDSLILISLWIAKCWRFDDIFSFFFFVGQPESMPYFSFLSIWPRQIVSHILHTTDNFHQVWSWYDRPLLSYSIFPVDMMWPCDLDLWPFDHGQWSLMALQVTWSTPPTRCYTCLFFSYELRCPALDG